MVWNTHENLDKTQERPLWLRTTVAEVAAWYIVRLSCFDAELNEIADELTWITALVGDECSYLSPYEIGFNSVWSTEQLRTEAIDILRSMEVTA
jgi:hypothetical protein